MPNKHISMIQKTTVARIFDVFFDLRLNNDRDAGDLSRHRAHYDVTVIGLRLFSTKPSICYLRRTVS